jgi:hypothetical protein
MIPSPASYRDWKINTPANTATPNAMERSTIQTRRSVAIAGLLAAAVRAG